MVYTNSRATIKWWDPHTNKLEYFSSAKFYENNNKCGKGWPTVSERMTGTNVSTFTTLQIDLSDHPLIKYYIY